METVGSNIARRSVALRNMYGQFPLYEIDEDGSIHFEENKRSKAEKKQDREARARKYKKVQVTWPEYDSVFVPVELPEGEQHTPLPTCPDYTKIAKETMERLPLNRADWRNRFRPMLPRAARLDTYSRRLHKGK